MNFVKNTLKKLNYIIALAALVALSACSTGPQPINYGQDGCEYCKMTIMDKKFGAEIVTKKGKVYKFDATECMISFVKKEYINEQDVAQYLVVDATNPGTLVSAAQASYLVSENLPSPMGGNINAFTDTKNLQTAFEKYGGKMLGWDELKSSY